MSERELRAARLLAGALAMILVDMDFDTSSRLEWLETNGVGGWASSTVSGANTRRYHGLLVAALDPPDGRHVLLSRLDDTIVSGDERHELGCSQFPGVVHPRGYRLLRSFTRVPSPTFEYEAGGVRLRKTVAAVRGENTTVVRYELLEAAKPPAGEDRPAEVHLELLPLVAARPFHELATANDRIGDCVGADGGTLRLRPYAGGTEFWIHVPGASFLAGADWYYRFEYERERERGLDWYEDLWTPGRFRCRLRVGERLEVVVSTHSPHAANALGREPERERRDGVATAPTVPADAGFGTVPAIGTAPAIATLRRAAEQFMVRGRDHAANVIAGYHWFGTWGRDTLISLPGLALATGRHGEARDVLRTCFASIDRGMLPNRFAGGAGGAPEYTAADAALWLFVALKRYVSTTGDIAFVRDEALPVLRTIVEWHDRGTRHGIRVDADGLLCAGAPGLALTWMDARVDGEAITPRRGKPVEINALWYNALRILADFEARYGDAARSASLAARARRVRRRFARAFHDDATGGLYDVIGPEGPDPSIRPNQVIAVGLPYLPVSRERAAAVLRLAERTLVTPVGLRSLAPEDPAYTPHYAGGPAERDRAYHQGTVWGWLIGPCATAAVKLHGTAGRARARELVRGLIEHLDDGCLGTCPEIFDGDPPHAPRGAVAQAWTVAELLRVLVFEIGDR